MSKEFFTNRKIRIGAVVAAGAAALTLGFPEAIAADPKHNNAKDGSIMRFLITQTAHAPWYHSKIKTTA